MHKQPSDVAGYRAQVHSRLKSLGKSGKFGAEKMRVRYSVPLAILVLTIGLFASTALSRGVQFGQLNLGDKVRALPHGFREAQNCGPALDALDTCDILDVSGFRYRIFDGEVVLVIADRATALRQQRFCIRATLRATQRCAIQKGIKMRIGLSYDKRNRLLELDVRRFVDNGEVMELRFSLDGHLKQATLRTELPYF